MEPAASGGGDEASAGAQLAPPASQPRPSPAGGTSSSDGAVVAAPPQAPPGGALPAKGDGDGDGGSEASSAPGPPAAGARGGEGAAGGEDDGGAPGAALAELGAVWVPRGFGASEAEAAEAEAAAERAAQDALAAQDGAAAHARAGGETLLHELLDCSDTLNAAAAAIVDDTFTKCFKSNAPDPWNWNLYLFPLWCAGVVVRYGVLFPIRLLSLLLGFLLFFSLFLPVHYLLGPSGARLAVEGALIELLAAAFVFSWTGVVRYHGPRPARRTGGGGGRGGGGGGGPGGGAARPEVYVANHTSMIDFIVLEQSTPFAVIMQKHGGWVGWMQSVVLASLGCIHFDRSEAADRSRVAARIRDHVHGPANNPLLIFPEGTCVNNEYVCMFKKGAFDLGVAVCPIAIKYNKIFVDAFWNSRREGFTTHLARLMTSWALVADVYYMEPQTKGAGESVEAFAERVRDLIAERAGLKPVPWDGMLKYYRPSPGMCAKQREAFAQRMLRRLALLTPAAGLKAVAGGGGRAAAAAAAAGGAAGGGAAAPGAAAAAAAAARGGGGLAALPEVAGS